MGIELTEEELKAFETIKFDKMVKEVAKEVATKVVNKEFDYIMSQLLGISPTKKGE